MKRIYLKDRLVGELFMGNSVNIFYVYLGIDDGVHVLLAAGHKETYIAQWPMETWHAFPCALVAGVVSKP